MTGSSDIVGQWAAAWSSGDIGNVTALFVDDCVYEDVTLGVVNHGKEELTAFGAAFFAAAPGLEIDVTARTVAGDRAAAEWWFRGVQEGEVLGMPATGKPFAFRGMSAFDLQGDKISRCS